VENKDNIGGEHGKKKMATGKRHPAFQKIENKELAFL